MEGVAAPRRALGLGDLLLFYIITGTSLRWIATAATAGPSAIVIWLIAWAAFYVPLALSVIELSSRYPEEGGLYLWSKRAFGEFAGFMAGWCYWASNLPFYPSVLYFAAANALYIHGGQWLSLAHSRFYFILFSLLGLSLPTLLNIFGLNVGKWLHNAGALGTWLPIGMLIVLGALAWARLGSASVINLRTIIPSTHLRDIFFWATVTFAFGGCESASLMGEEIRNPRRNLRPALLGAGGLTTASYIFGTLAILVALPAKDVSGLEGVMQAIAKIAARVGWAGVTPVAALLITVASVGAIGAWLAATARLPFVAGLDRILPPILARQHPKWRSPYVALLVQAVAGAFFVLLGQAGTTTLGAYEALVSVSVIAYFIPFLFIFASLIHLQRETVGPGVIRVPGGKKVATGLALLGLATSSITIFVSIFAQPDEPTRTLGVVRIVGLSALLLAAGAALYFAGKRRQAREATLE